MTPHDAPDAPDAPLTRRERRRRLAASTPAFADATPTREAAVATAVREDVTDPESTDASTDSPTDASGQSDMPTDAPAPAEAPDVPARPEQATRWADAASPATALAWVDPAVVADASEAADSDEGRPSAASDLWTDGPHRLPGPGLLVPIGAVAALAAAYATAALVWPLHELPPTVEAVDVTPVAADPAQLTWPKHGSAAISVDGVGAAANSDRAVPIASITKVVSVMLVLDEMPLRPGEQGPSFSFSYRDSRDYWSYLRDNQSALDVPVGGELTEYQMLQGILLGSANNYIDHLADEIWGSDADFAAAAQIWLDARGLDGITIVTPSGRDDENVATPEALTRLADIAMANPVFAEIVATPSVDLPGAGTVRNSNGLLKEPGFVGLKTGTLDHQYNLLSAKDVDIDGTTVRLYASVLGQQSNDDRLTVSRRLHDEAEAALRAQPPAVDAGTVVGEIDTPWGERVDVVTDADASVVLWNGAAAATDVVFDLGDAAVEGDDVGTITVRGPIDTVEIPVSLAEDLEGPSAWWRLTHPLELFGVTG